MTPGLDRDEIVRRFEALLDSALASEAPPAGLDPAILSAALDGDGASGGEHSDSYSLWASMTGLIQEIKLQGRAFQELNQTLAAQTEKVSAELRAAYAERERALQREAERRCRREIVGGLIDLRDRMGRGHESAQSSLTDMAAQAREGWWARFRRESKAADAGLDVVKALIRGYELSLERLDQTLSEFNVREIDCAGASFDPKRMNAIEIEETAAVPSGTVLEVYRRGYEWNGDVFRPAQVKVSRAPGGSGER